MSSTQERKKSENYSYSWFLPGPGSKGSATSQAPAPDTEATPTGKGQGSGHEAQEARTEEWMHSADHTAKAAEVGSGGLSQTKIKIAGIAGWSAIAGAGGVLLATRAGSFPPLQMGILVGVWAGIAAAIWFVPGFLLRKGSPRAS